MEGAGMDAYTMATKVGWGIYPIGKYSSPSDVPHGTRVGLVLIYKEKKLVNCKFKTLEGKVKK